jgi:urea transport system substrate-binding protein
MLSPLNRLNRRKFLGYGATAIGTSLLLKGCAATPRREETIKVGVLHSLSGTMSFSEKSVVDSTMLAIEEINAAGGIGGKKIEAIQEDGASDWSIFTAKARKLIEQDQVVVIFGCWTSASRKAVLPVVEEKNHMLYYPVQYEGQECSKNIFYTGAAPNQQIEPSVDWLLENKGKEFYLVGSDYIFPKTANAIVKAQLADRGGKMVGESYLPLGGVEVAPIIDQIKSVLPKGGVIYNTLNGDSNVAFFKQMQGAGLTPEKYPVMSVSIAEEEVKSIGTEFLKGHYATWNYFMTVDSPANQKYVQAFKKIYGDDRVTNDPMEAGYISVNIWKQAVEKAGSAGSPTDLEKVRAAAYGQAFDAPEGLVVMNSNHHLSKTVRIGEVRGDGMFEIVFSTPAPIDPVPWNQFVRETKGFTCDWTKTDLKGGETPGKFRR